MSKRHARGKARGGQIKKAGEGGQTKPGIITQERAQKILASQGVEFIPNAKREGQTSAAAAAETVAWQVVCGWTGLTDRRHRQLAELGFFPAPVRGQYDREKTLTGLFRYFQEQLEKRDDSLKLEQKKLAVARREKLEEETAVLRDEYVRKAEIGPALRNVSLHQRATLQFKMENELAPKLAGKTTAEILGEIRGAVDQVCAVFQEGTRKWLNSAP